VYHPGDSLVADPVVGRLRCQQCGNECDCHEREGLEFAAHHSWPRCCGEIMQLLEPLEVPTAAVPHSHLADKGNGQET